MVRLALYITWEMEYSVSKYYIDYDARLQIRRFTCE